MLNKEVMYKFKSIIMKPFDNIPPKLCGNGTSMRNKTNCESQDPIISELEAKIKELKLNKVELDSEVKTLKYAKKNLIKDVDDLTSKKKSLQKDCETLEDKIEVQTAKLNDLHINEELKNNDTSSMPIETLSLFATIYSTLASLDDNSHIVNLREEISSHMISVGYAFVPYSEINKDCYFVREMGIKKNIRTAIKDLDSGEVIISGEIYI